MWGISIIADFRPMCISFHAVVVFDLGKNLLFKSALGHCVVKRYLCQNLRSDFHFLPSITKSYQQFNVTVQVEFCDDVTKKKNVIRFI